MQMMTIALLLLICIQHALGGHRLETGCGIYSDGSCAGSAPCFCKCQLGTSGNPYGNAFEAACGSKSPQEPFDWYNSDEITDCLYHCSNSSTRLTHCNNRGY